MCSAVAVVSWLWRLLFFVHQILKTLKLLPIGNKTVVRDSRILSVVEKWSSEMIPNTEHSTEVSTTVATAETTDITASAKSADVMEDLERAGSGTEAKEVNDRSELMEKSAEKRQLGSVNQDDVDIHQSLVSKVK